MHILKGKTALITGGTSGIGRAIAHLFTKKGANVVIWGTNQAKADAVLKELEELRAFPEQKLSASLVNVASHEEVKMKMEELLKEGSIEILVNSAGITKDTLLMKMSEEAWDDVIDINLKSIYNTCKALCRPMMKAKEGVIINISSVIGLIGNSGQANYAASKAGMIGFTKSLAKELGPRKVRANCIAPGYIETQMTEELPQNIKDLIIAKIPMGHIGQPGDIAEAALFLATAPYVTGQVLTVDGGMVM